MPNTLLAMFTSGGPIKSAVMLDAIRRDPGVCESVDAATGNTALHFTCCNGAPEPIVRALLDAYPAAAKVRDLDGNVPLFGAVSCGAEPAVVKLLLDAHPGAARELVGGRTPLHYACCHQCAPETARLLIDAWPGACGVRDADGNAPLHFALVRSARADVVALLVAVNPGVCATRGFMGRLPLSLALLYEAAPETVDAVRDAYPDAMRNEEIVADYRNHGKLADYAHCAKCEPEPPRASGWERGHHM